MNEQPADAPKNNNNKVVIILVGVFLMVVFGVGSCCCCMNAPGLGLLFVTDKVLSTEVTYYPECKKSKDVDECQVCCAGKPKTLGVYGVGADATGNQCGCVAMPFSGQ